MSLTPTLTRLDEVVLAAVPHDRGARMWTIYLTATTHRDESREDVLLVLRGLEHLGYVTNNNGWWRRVR